MATILVVDDRRQHRKATRLVLERAGHRVVETGDGQEALERARADAPDLVLSDVMRPGPARGRRHGAAPRRLVVGLTLALEEIERGRVSRRRRPFPRLPPVRLDLFGPSL